MPKKIVQVIDTLEQGGAQKLIFDLIKILKKEFNFYVLAFEGGVFEERIKKLGIPIEILGISPYKIGFKYPQNILKTLKSLRKKIKEINPDIIQTHLLGADIWGRLAVAKNIKTIQTIHSAEKFRGTFSIKGIKTFFFDQILFKKTDLIIAVSQAAAEGLIRQRIDRRKIRIVPVGIDIGAFAINEFWRQKKREELKIKKDEILIGAVGRLDYIKGFDILLRAFSKARSKDNRLRLVIAGEGRERKNLVQIIKKEKIIEGAKLLGERKDVAKLFNAFDIFVLPSREEGFGIVLLEAAANQKPIIAARTGGISEFIKDKINGLLFKSENVFDLTKKIELVLENKALREKIAKNAFKKVKIYDIRKIAERYKKIYSFL